MNEMQTRFLMFLLGCIPVRLLFVVLAYLLARNKLSIWFLNKKNNKQYLRRLAYLAILPMLGFIIIWAFGLRKTGRETQGREIYWNFARPIHAGLYLFFILSVLGNNKMFVKNAYLWLLADVVIGLFIFFYYHYTHGNFKKL